ncbi:MAG TPA: MMPL family transporter [Actinomycetota bacterium]
MNRGAGARAVDEGDRPRAARSPASDRAVAVGLQRTGRVVTAAGALMVVVFLGFAVAELLPLKAMGVGMIVAIVLDVTVVRLLLVPATMTLLGHWNWWAPPRLRRLHARLAASRTAPAAPAGSLEATRKGRDIGVHRT